MKSWSRRNLKIVDIDLGTRRNEKHVFKSPKKEQIYAVKDRQWKQWLCIFCDGSDHKSTVCTKVTDLNERKKIFSSKKLYFNCSGSKHHAFECKSELDAKHVERNTILPCVKKQIHCPLPLQVKVSSILWWWYMSRQSVVEHCWILQLEAHIFRQQW